MDYMKAPPWHNTPSFFLNNERYQNRLFKKGITSSTIVDTRESTCGWLHRGQFFTAEKHGNLSLFAVHSFIFLIFTSEGFFSRKSVFFQ